MGFLSFWPLALLVLVPIIILLYILRQETKAKEFSSSMLWQEVIRNMEATRPWEKLKRNILLFLQILTVILFVIAMMHPWIKGLGGNNRQVVLVLDNSASMDSLYDDNISRLEAAKEAACSYVSDLPSSASIYVISGNKEAVLELANSSDKIEAKNRIRNISQTSLAGDMSVTLGLVESCINQAANPEVIFFTDTEFDTGGIEASIDSFYSETVNVSMDSVSFAQKEDEFLVLAQLTNHSNDPLSREINLYGVDMSGKETLLDIVSVDIKGKETESTYFEIDKAKLNNVTALHAQINDKDALLGDNSAWCVLGEQKEKEVLIYTKSNMFIEKAMDNLSGINVYRTSDAEVFDKENNYDLYIFDGMLPDKLPQKGAMLFINCKSSELFSSNGEVESTRLSIIESELSNYIEETKVGVNKSYTYETPAWARDYIETNQNKSAGFYGIYDGRKLVTIGFDLHQTDFGLLAEFPILISNISNYMLDGSLIEKNSYIAGDSIMLHGSTKGSNLSIVDPEGKKTSLMASEVAGSYMQADTPGIYNVSQELDGNNISQQFVAMFPTAIESDVASVENTIVSNENAKQADIKAGTFDLSNYIIVFLLILMIAEWIVYVKLM